MSRFVRIPAETGMIRGWLLWPLRAHHIGLRGKSRQRRHPASAAQPPRPAGRTRTQRILAAFPL